MAGAATGMKLIRSHPGMMAAIARGLGVTRPAVIKWQQVPAERVIAVERITGLPREKLRPDLYKPARRVPA
jgi:DNA-binding transcriptional regulator YdaS (Cro superfamily)